MYIRINDDVVLNTDGIREIRKTRESSLEIRFGDGYVIGYECGTREIRDELFDNLWGAMERYEQTK